MKQILFNIEDQEKKDFLVAIKNVEGDFGSISKVLRELIKSYVDKTRNTKPIKPELETK